LTLELLDERGATVDSVESYAGLRSVAIDGRAVKINGDTIFQRLVLDQGYYPDGILTAADDEQLVRDIRLSMQAGFNGARLHQKVFEERFLYHADRMGYLCWGEFGDWGMWGDDNPHYNQPGAAAVAQWLAAIERDYSHPCIVGWCPLNETRQNIEDKYPALDDVTRAMFYATKALDQTRPVIDASGYAHRVIETDVYDSHNYEQDPQKFARQMRGTGDGKPFVNLHNDRPMSLPYNGQPYFCSEFGGTWWSNDATHDQRLSWGYGQHPTSREEAQDRVEALIRILLEDPDMFGYCYTQLTDVFQEQNGIYTFDRRPKFDLERLRKLQTSPAAIERKK
jgi:beta-galactosidase/beta-glucuronidase